MSRHEKGSAPRYKMISEERDIAMSLLLERSGGHCEHPKGCNEARINKLTLDHFTPQAIALIWGWTPEEVNDPSNHLLLCQEHHDEKDAQTMQLKIDNRIEFSVFKPFAIEQRRKQKQKALDEGIAA